MTDETKWVPPPPRDCGTGCGRKALSLMLVCEPCLTVYEASPELARSHAFTAAGNRPASAAAVVDFFTRMAAERRVAALAEKMAAAAKGS